MRSAAGREVLPSGRRRLSGPPNETAGPTERPAQRNAPPNGTPRPTERPAQRNGPLSGTAGPTEPVAAQDGHTAKTAERPAAARTAGRGAGHQEAFRAACLVWSAAS